MSVQLVFISEANLRDRMFVRDLVHNFKLQRSITVHAPVADVRQTRMTTKRLSSLMSDALTYNRAFSGDQRGLVTWDGQYLHIDRPRIEALLDHVQTLVLGPIAKGATEATLIDPIELLLALRAAFDVEEVITFSDNPLSPLVSKRPLISTKEDVDHWMTAYEEEKGALARALALRPARLSSPANFAL